jgi:hypothetical protein
MEMRFMWVGDKISQQMYKLIWHPGQENLADYQSKHHIRAHHVNVRPYYLHMENFNGVVACALNERSRDKSRLIMIRAFASDTFVFFSVVLAQREQPAAGWNELRK